MVYVIAEAGVNHNGDLELAKKLIIVAKKAGANAVKFQTFKSELVMSKYAPKAEYQIENTEVNESQLDMVRKLELSYDDFQELAKYCKKVDITFISTPFDLDSVQFLDELEIPFWKIPSGEITNLPYLIKIGKTHKPVIMSTGMGILSEIRAAINILKDSGCPKITLLHCNTAYPTPIEDVNLRAMLTLKKTFDLPVGYSDHTTGIDVTIAAVAMGAEVIEKHFTLDKTMGGPDHKASLEPDELNAMISAIRRIEIALGYGEKVPSPSELANKDIARKSIVAKTDIKKMEVFTEANIAVKRPGNGISPMKWFEVLGQKAVRDFVEDELIEL